MQELAIIVKESYVVWIYFIFLKDCKQIKNKNEQKTKNTQPRMCRPAISKIFTIWPLTKFADVALWAYTTF